MLVLGFTRNLDTVKSLLILKIQIVTVFPPPTQSSKMTQPALFHQLLQRFLQFGKSAPTKCWKSVFTPKEDKTDSFKTAIFE